MQIDPTTMNARDRYRLMISCVVPRPIALVSTVGADGRTNVAPFSFFGGVSTAPPTIMISPGMRQGVKKDTLRTIEATREVVVNVVTESIADPMVAASADWPPGLPAVGRRGDAWYSTTRGLFEIPRPPAPALP